MAKALTAKQSQAIENLLKDFNFEHVQAFMTLTRWHWRGERNAPTLAELKACAKRLLRDVMQQGCTRTASGGFVAERDFDGDQEEVSLLFYVSKRSEELF